MRTHHTPKRCVFLCSGALETLVDDVLAQTPGVINQCEETLDTPPIQHDRTPPVQMRTFLIACQIWHDMYGVKAKGVLPFSKAPLLASPPPPPRELLWKLPYELKRDVVCAHKEFDEACEGYTLDAVEFRDFGKNSCKVCVCVCVCVCAWWLVL